MQRRGVGHGAKRIVRRDAHEVRLGHGRDLLAFEQSAAVAEVGLDHVAGLFLEDLAELVARNQPLAGRDRNPHGLPHLPQRVDIFRRHRLFTEERRGTR